MKAFEEEFGLPPYTAGSSDIMTTTRTAYYRNMKRVWRAALEWLQKHGDGYIIHEIWIDNELEN